jgi:ATP diphosphatase
VENSPDTVEQLRIIMQQLRDPQTGCAWDVQQTFQSIAPFTVEEAYEVADAIERNDLADLKDELGDLLFQVVFHAQIASEMGAFNFDDVARAIVDKMTRRHPHVFADMVYRTEDELKAAWEAIKAEERLAKSSAGTLDTTLPISALDGVATNLPALKRADKVQKRAARVGFDWPSIEPVWLKLDEEIAEVREAIERKSPSDIEDELGDLLFTVVNLARHCSVDSEVALRRASRKFEQRFKHVESLAASKGQRLKELTVPELDLLWTEAKSESLNYC